MNPHTKLIRRDSDLRIYCYWKDERIADGSKVLIGRIGRHPWKNDTQKEEKNGFIYTGTDADVRQPCTVYDYYAEWR